MDQSKEHLAMEVMGDARKADPGALLSVGQEKLSHGPFMKSPSGFGSK